jgi:hypothetical protein
MPSRPRRHHWPNAIPTELGLTDASIAVIAARHHTANILTLDERHFRAVRPLWGEAFRLLPADAG